MILAVLGSVDGHADGLKLALDVIEDEGVITVLQAGNAAWGPDGSRCIALLREHGVQCVQGQRDRFLARLERKRARLERELGDALPAYEDAHAALRGADVEWLGTLPHERRLMLDGVPVLLCHGIPGDGQHFFTMETQASRLQRAREAASADIIASGGAPEAFVCASGGCLLLNAPAFTERRTAWLRVNTEALTAEAVVV